MHIESGEMKGCRAHDMERKLGLASDTRSCERKCDFFRHSVLALLLSLHAKLNP